MSEKQRRMIYQKEMLEASETAKALVEGMKNTASDFTTATHVEHAKAMFKVTLTPSHPHTLTPSHPHPHPGLLDPIPGGIQCCPERRR